MSALWALLLFAILVTFLGVAIWLLIRLFRNENFIPNNRGLRITVKVLLVVFTVFIPVLGVVALFAIWFFTRPEDAEPPGAAGAEAVATDETTRAPRLPFPPP